MVKMEEITYITQAYNELRPLGKEVCRITERSGIQNGIVHVITKHTTTGITVNECLECLEDDILGWLGVWDLPGSPPECWDPSCGPPYLA